MESLFLRAEESENIPKTDEEIEDDFEDDLEDDLNEDVEDDFDENVESEQMFQYMTSNIEKLSIKN